MKEENMLSKMLESKKNEFNLSYRDIAKQLNVNPSTVHRWFTNESKIDVNYVSELCKLFEITPNDLFKWDKGFLANSNSKADEMSSEADNMNKKFNKLEITSDGFITEVSINGMQLNNVNSFEFRHEAGDVPCVKIDMDIIKETVVTNIYSDGPGRSSSTEMKENTATANSDVIELSSKHGKQIITKDDVTIIKN